MGVLGRYTCGFRGRAVRDTKAPALLGEGAGAEFNSIPGPESEQELQAELDDAPAARAGDLAGVAVPNRPVRALKAGVFVALNASARNCRL